LTEKSVPTAAAKKISPARLAAFRVLERVGCSDEHSDDLLHGRALAGLSQVDINLANALVLGVLRWQIAIDARIHPLLQRPDITMPSAVATALRLGALQLLYMDRIPAHAALSESVELMRAAHEPQAAGMVNAVLRAMTRQGAVRRPLVESTTAVAQRLGHPAWLVERWVKRYGSAAAIAICEFDQKEPGDAALFKDIIANGVRIDDGSRLIAEIAQMFLREAAQTNGAALKIWDCCAAPGGKTAVLAARHPEASVLASDVSPRRLKAMAERMGAESRIRTLVADAIALPEDEGDFDLILCDAPCSGTGTLARNPEIRHRLRPEELKRQAVRQKQLLAAVAGRLKPGGRLVYSTCSLEQEENEAVVEAVLAAGAPLRRISVESTLTALESSGTLKVNIAAVSDGYLRTLPGANFDGDGFFTALFERV
jgi:16S rRNA (cytosine967-C5)-methyltransferase